jgi:hypothetical protein
MQVLCGLSGFIKMLAQIGDQAGQVGESGEYLMGRAKRGLDHKFRAPR